MNSPEPGDTRLKGGHVEVYNGTGWVRADVVEKRWRDSKRPIVND